MVQRTVRKDMMLELAASGDVEGIGRTMYWGDVKTRNILIDSMPEILITDKFGIMADNHFVRSLWVPHFDQSLSSETRERIRVAMRGYVRAKMDELLSSPDRDRKVERFVADVGPAFKRLPQKPLLALVMRQGYTEEATYSCLNYALNSEDFVLIGYSTGRYAQDKVFEDGSTMNGKVYLSDHDLSIISSMRRSPVIFIDDVIHTGATITAIGNALRDKVGCTGNFYQSGEFVGDTFRIMQWNGRLVGHVKKAAQEDTPIITESGEVPFPNAANKRSLIGSIFRK